MFRGPCGCNILYELRAYQDSNTRQSQDNTLIILRLWSNLDQTSNHIIKFIPMAIFYFLQDILENEDVKLDHMFIASLVADIVKVCLMNGNLRESLRYIRLDFANRVLVNLWSRVIVS